MTDNHQSIQRLSGRGRERKSPLSPECDSQCKHGSPSGERVRVRGKCDAVRSPLIAMATVVLAFAALPLHAADALTVPEFNKLKPRWDSLASLKAAYVVVGRYSSVAGGSMRLKNCEIQLHAAAGKSLPRVYNRQKNLEIRGHFDRFRGRVVFIVDKLTERPSDLAALRERERDLKRAEPAEWYAAAQEFLETAKYYNDEELRTASTRMLDKALRHEISELGREDSNGLRTVAGRVAEFGLSESLRMELLHRSFVIDWKKLQSNRATTLEQFKEFGQTVAKALPGCATPVKPFPKNLFESWKRNHNTTYEQADEAKRRQLHRVFFTEIQLAALRADPRSKDESNGFELAAELERNLPDRPAEADRYREMSLDWKKRNAASLDRNELRDLIDYLKRTGEEQQAVLIVESHVARLRQGVPADLIQAGRDYIELIGKDEEAIKLFKEAWEKLKELGLENSPDAKDVIKELKRHSWHRVGDQWLTTKQKEQKEAAELGQEVGFGDPQDGASGDTAGAIRSALGKPDRITRIVSAGMIHEIWIYATRAYHFRREPRQKADAAIRFAESNVTR